MRGAIPPLLRRCSRHGANSAQK